MQSYSKVQNKASTSTVSAVKPMAALVKAFDNLKIRFDEEVEDTIPSVPTMVLAPPQFAKGWSTLTEFPISIDSSDTLLEINSTGQSPFVTAKLSLSLDSITKLEDMFAAIDTGLDAIIPHENYHIGTKNIDKSCVTLLCRSNATSKFLIDPVKIRNQTMLVSHPDNKMFPSVSTMCHLEGLVRVGAMQLDKKNENDDLEEPKYTISINVYIKMLCAANCTLDTHLEEELADCIAARPQSSKDKLKSKAAPKVKPKEEPKKKVTLPVKSEESDDDDVISDNEEIESSPKKTSKGKKDDSSSDYL